MSERYDVAEKLANWIASYPAGVDERLFNAPWGVLNERSPHKQCRTITFGKARWLDASIDIYSERFIVVRWSGVSAAGNNGQVTFKGDTALADVYKFIAENLA